MVVAIPFLFAAVGYGLAYGTAYATLAAAVGWTIGAWLFGPKADYGNQIFDPGAEELPRINQALRGATMPLLFGTNRVSSNIVWTKNFTTIRKESTTGSGGKSGGSGGKGGSGPTNVSYEYKWDMLFHIGMAPSPMTLFGGWMNATKLDSSTVNAIASASGAEALNLEAQPGDDAGLSFEDSYFGAAWPTGSDGQESWDYFATQEAVAAARFPNTTYVGFQQLYLGQSPNVPQLSWEVGPGQAEITQDPLNVSNYDTGKNNVSTFAYGFHAGEAIIEGLDGKFYTPIATTGGTTAYIGSLGSNNPLTLTRATIYADVVSAGGSGAHSTFSDPIIIPAGRERFWAGFTTLDGGVNMRLKARMYCINAAGAIEAVDGGWSFIDQAITLYTFPWQQSNVVGIGRSGEGTDDDPIYFLCYATGNTIDRVCVCYLPAYSGGGVITQFGYRELTAIEDTVAPGRVFKTDTGDLGAQSQSAWFVGKADIGLLGLTWTTRMYVYRSKRQMGAYSPSATIAAWDAAYPDGYVYQYTFGQILSTESTPEVETGAWVDRTGQPFDFPPFDDDQTDLADAVDTLRTEYRAPTIVKLDSYQYTWAALWPKHYFGSGSDRVSYPGDLVYTSVRVMVWNAFNQQWVYMGAYTEAPYGVVNSSANYVMATIPWYDQATGKVYAAGMFEEGDNDVWITTGQLGDLDIGGQTDVTPAYIIYEIMTNEVFGLGIDPSIIDGYAAAVAYCENNDIKVSVQYVREENVLQIIEELLALFNCFLIVTGGRIRFGLQDFSTDPVRTIDNDHFVVDEGRPPVDIVKGARQDSYNKIRFNYLDRALAYRQNQVEVADEVDMDLTGVRLKEFPPRFVMTEQLAGQIATRALWTNLYSRDAYRFNLGPKDQDLEPGDPITLVDSFHNELSGGVRARIGMMKRASATKWEVTAVRELEYTQNASYQPFDVSSPEDKAGTVGGVAAPLDFRAYELPSEHQLSDPQVLFGYNPGARSAGARLYISPDGVTYGVAGDIQPFVINGIFADPLPSRPIGYVEQDVIVYLSPVSGFSTATPTYVQTYDIDDVSEAGRESGLGVLIAGSEMLAMEGVTVMAQNKYRIDRLYRGWGGTAPQDHSSGAYWHRHGGGVLGVDITPDRIGTQFYYKVQPYNFANQGYNIASIAAKTWTVKDWPVTPQAVGELSVYATSATNGQSLAVQGYRNVVAGGSPVAVRWSAASRTTGFGAGGYGQGAGGFGRFTRDVTTPSYRFEVMSANGFVVRSTTVNTEAYDYSVDNNSTDFNGWKGNFQLRVTPYNGYGNTPISTVYSANLF